MLSKKLPLLGPNKEREECIVLPAADTGGGGVTSGCVVFHRPSVPQSVFTITEKALVGAFSVIVKTDCGTDGTLHIH